MHCFEETRLLNCGSHDIFLVVMDIERYPEFLPWVSEAVVLTAGDDQLSAELVADFSGMKYTFRTVDRFVVDRMVEIRLLDGPFRFLESFWTFETVENNRCRVHFSIEFEFKNIMVSLIATPIFTAACKSMVQAFEQRVYQCKKKI
ncbi:MAG: type II toxin-antitoxin system RatA family toxin [Mariprofundaceae bacterium]|nr:type II toxin-antitoxin system RatA family toxin [Mariprofundaceae bacterium]